MKKLPIGISDFKIIIEENYYYIDKTLLIKDILDITTAAALIPRPRRFGKTLNLSMLKYYFERTGHDNSSLFHNLSISRQGEVYRWHQGRYPVIFLTFKDVNFSHWESCYNHLKIVIANEYRRHDYLLKSDIPDQIQKNTYTEIMALKAGKADYCDALSNLSRYLADYHAQKVMILIDEYDTPIQQGYLNGYYDQIIEFMRVFLSSALKDNSYLARGILTGILRVAKESIFTGLNNFEVYSILKNEFSTSFGFLEREVNELFAHCGILAKMAEARSWYNGYIFGCQVLYNPWSVLKYAKEHQYGFISHWVNTSGNALIKNLLTGGGEHLKSDVEKLLRGEAIEKVIDEDIVFNDLRQDREAVWSLLLFTGYLKAVSKTVQDGQWRCFLQLPNREVAVFYRKTVLDWFRGSISSEKMQDMLEGLVSGEMAVFESHFRQFVNNSMSYFDPVGDEPERVYQAFVLGMLVTLSDNFYVKSNRESGRGRYDIAIYPRNLEKYQKGIIFEFKKVNQIMGETLPEALGAAEKQIAEKNYQAELEDAGLRKENIIKTAVAFHGKDLLLKWWNS